MKKFKIKREVTVEEEVGYPMFIAWRVKQLRKDANMNQEDFGKMMGLSRVSIVNIEKGRQALTMKNLYSICEELNIKSSQILPF